MRSKLPPGWIFRILNWFCPAHLSEEIEGDLTQKFYRDLEKYSRSRAVVRLFFRTVMFFRPGIILRNKIVKIGREFILFQNNIATAARHMRKNKVFTFITIFALSVSIASCILISQYASFELSFDKYYPNADNLYRLNLQTYENGVLRNESAELPSEAWTLLRQNIAGLENNTQFETARWWFTCAFTYRNGSASRTFNEGNVSYTAPGTIKLFDIRIKSGDSKNALSEPFTTVISESTAKKYFGDEDPIGKVLHLRGSNDNHDYTVVAVMEDQPMNSHYRNDILLSYSSTEVNPNHESNNISAYVLLDELTPVSDIQERITAFAAQYAAPDKIKYNIHLEHVPSIHNYSTAEDQFNMAPDIRLLYFLLAIGFIVLALAWINYVNLSIARSFARAKEVGVRKTAGATYRQIASQFLSETLVFNVISMIIAIILVRVSAPWFYEFVGLKFPWDDVYWKYLGSTTWIVVAIFVGGMFISGFLPARLMAAIPTITVLKGKFMGVRNSSVFRRSLVVFQFSCAIALLLATVVFNRQFDVMKNKDAGIDFKRTLIVLSPANADSSFRTRLAQLRSSLQNNSVAEKVFTSGLVFENSDGWTAGVSREKENDRQVYYVNIIDPGFIEGYGLKLLAGRNFVTTDYPLKKFFDKVEPVIINRTGAARLGFQKPDDAIGNTIYWDGNECRVVGVIEDYYQRSMKKAMGPAIYTANDGSLLSLQLSAGALGDNLKESVLSIQREWDKFFPENAFDYFMLADHYDSLYTEEQRLKNVFEFFSALALIISCLGLFALSLFSINQRAKEMSIRKVLGAPSRHLMHLLTREYLWMILVAGMIAIPVASWAIEQWLSIFALRVDITIPNMIIPIILVLLFALLSIGIQTWKLIKRNPSQNLKVE